MPVKKVKELLETYGLGLLFTANVFGAGSVYILSNTGAKFGYALLWTMPLSLLLGLGMHEMSGRLATINQPLMEYIRDTVGASRAKPLAYFLAFIMHFWAISNYTITGAALVWLTPLNNLYVGVILGAGIGISLVELRLYNRVEAAIAAFILTVFSIYIVIAAGLTPPVQKVALGFVPAIQANYGYLVMVMALLGTTVYYPNFFIQSSISESKGFSEMRRYRRDHFVGLCFVVLLSTAVLVVAAMTLKPHTPTLASPANPLHSKLGSWAPTVFVVAVFLASISSATGTLFAAGYIVPQSRGRKPAFGNRSFRRVVELLIVMSVGFIVLLIETTGANPVELGILMPAINGVIGLPITVVALYMANERFFDHPRWLRVGLGIAVVVTIILALVSAVDLVNTISKWF
ncbi:NRAMP family divalent metal transporter [Haladaptatus halobius]|uniref:NRAMP family divalent metal transporter n=1 Tax=Haladaptatus halobius TaxID=2884875 RepID=UPI001D0A9056|nr:divalent metal cation transporter [Haladaptatus halobius]